mgnify:CR=1
MCGDHCDVIYIPPAVRGSPPHVRGPHIAMQWYSLFPGITPACAGTTWPGLFFGSYLRDHPRMCGDHNWDRPDHVEMEGSPPHVRGPPATIHMIALYMGITPACAGTTERYKRQCGYEWDHPRMCGDHAKAFSYKALGKGSPPHVRGPQSPVSLSKCQSGITPACAGTTFSSICNK